MVRQQLDNARYPIEPIPEDLLLYHVLATFPIVLRVVHAMAGE
jgi:hypothetical protein